MAKHVNEAMTSFGLLLAQLRKSAGFTQQELADEIGVSRRVIAYYEAESQHPPANLLIDLSKTLGVTCDELLGLKPVAESPKGTTRLERRLKLIEKLQPKAKRQLTQLIDTFIEAEQLKQQS